LHFFSETEIGPGLPDGIFPNQKSQFGHILEGLALEDVGMFYGLLAYFAAIWYVVRPFGVFYGHLVYFPLDKSGNPGLDRLLPTSPEKNSCLKWGQTAVEVEDRAEQGDRMSL
jgi:hypothetical protein